MKTKPYYKAVRLDRTSHYDKETAWQVGETVAVVNLDPPEKGVCGRGIHCSLTLLDAVAYQQSSSRYAIVEPIDIIATDEDKVRCRAVRVIRWIHQVEQDELAGCKLWEANHAVNPLLRKRRSLPLAELCVAYASVRASVRASVCDSVYDSVRDSVRASVHASVRASVCASVYASVRDSVCASVHASVRDSVRASVHASVRASVRASVHASVRDSVCASVYDSVYGYIGGLFPDIITWHYAESLGPDPWRPLLKLWYGGYMPSFNGTTWRLHTGRNAEVVYEWQPEGGSDGK